MTHAPLPQSVDPHDVLGTDALLSDEERMLRDTVRQFVGDRILPEVGDWFDQGIFPKDHGANHSFYDCFISQGNLSPSISFSDPVDAFISKNFYDMGSPAVKIPLGISELFIERILENVAFYVRNFHGQLFPFNEG